MDDAPTVLVEIAGDEYSVRRATSSCAFSVTAVARTFRPRSAVVRRDRDGDKTGVFLRSSQRGQCCDRTRIRCRSSFWPKRAAISLLTNGKHGGSVTTSDLLQGEVHALERAVLCKVCVTFRQANRTIEFSRIVIHASRMPKRLDTHLQRRPSNVSFFGRVFKSKCLLLQIATAGIAAER